MIKVEICYAQLREQLIIPLQVPSNCTAIKAIMLSGILDRFPNINLKINEIGIFSKKIPLNHMLVEGDRVEIYRPLSLNPNQLRLMRAKKV